MADNSKKLPPLPESQAKEFVDLWNSMGDPEVQKQLKDAGVTTDQAKELLKNMQQERMKNFSVPEEHSDIVKTALGLLDYGAGFVRTPSMEIAAAISGPRGREAVSKNLKQDWADTVTPFDNRPAPSTAEWLNRMGLKKGQDLTGKVLQIPWDTFFFPKKMLTGQKTPPAPGPDWYDVASMGGDAGLSPGGLGLVQKGVKTLGATRYPIAERIGRLLQGKGTFPNQDLYNMTAAEAEKALKASPTFAQKYVVPTAKFAADPLAFTAPRLGESMYKGVFAEPDRLSKAAGFGEVSPTLMEEGLWGSPGTVYDDAQKYGKDVAGKLQKFRDVVTDAAEESDYDLVRTRKSIRAPMKQFFADATPEYGQDAVDAAKDAVWDQWNQTFPDKKILEMEDLHNVKNGFQGMAREANAFKDRPRITTGNPKASVIEGRTAELTGDAYKEQAKIARQAEEALYDDFSRTFNDEHGIDTASAGSILHLNNRKLGALMAAEPGLLQRYRFSPTQQSFGGAGAQMLQEYFRNPSDALRTGLGLLGARYGQAAGMGLRGAALGAYGPQDRKNPWTLMNVDLSGAGDTSYDQ